MVVCRLSCSAACGILFSNQGLNLILCIVTCVCVYVCVHVCTCVHMQARALSCLTLCDPKDCCPPGFSVHGDSPGKNTGMGCHAFLQGIFPTQRSNHWTTREVLICLSLVRGNTFKNNFLCPHPCPTLWDPIDCIPSGFSVYGILQARTLEWVAISFSRGSLQPTDLILHPALAGRFFTSAPPGKPLSRAYLLLICCSQKETPLMYWMGDLLAHSVVEVIGVIMRRSLMIPERSLERLLFVLMRLVSLLIRQ